MKDRGIIEVYEIDGRTKFDIKELSDVLYVFSNLLVGKATKCLGRDKK